MKKEILVAFAFLGGAAVGAVATWKIVKNKYEQIAQEEINEMKKFYADNYTRKQPTEDGSDTAEPIVEVSESEHRQYSNIVSNYSNNNNKEKGGSDLVELGTTPYIISPDEYGETEEFDLYGFTYYADGVLTDERDEPIEDVEAYVCADFASHFGEFVEDVVHVRNSRLKIDYEIQKDLRNYSDVHDSGLDPSGIE